jgi:hypothetical protein
MTIALARAALASLLARASAFFRSTPPNPAASSSAIRIVIAVPQSTSLYLDIYGRILPNSSRKTIAGDEIDPAADLNDFNEHCIQ